MSEPRPVDESVPDHVLDELKRAFDDASAEGAVPAVDVVAGVGPDHASAAGAVDGSPAPTSDPAGPPADALLDERTDDASGEAALEPTGAPSTDSLAGDVDAQVSAAEQPATVVAVLDGAGASGAPLDALGATAAAPEARTTIVIGDDDQLPDLQYLDELTGTQEQSTAIVIGDELDSTGAFDAVPLPSRSMDPRVRERRIAVKRERGRRRLIIVGSIAAVVVVAVSVLAVLASSLFSVEVVDVQGAPYTEARNGEELQAVIDSLLGEPVLLVDTQAARRSLEEIPWVERAFVTTDFPDRVLIDIRERRPLATFAGSDRRWRVIDRDGRVLDVLDGQPIDYMPIEGLTPDSEPGQLAGTPFALAAQLVAALPSEIRSITEAVTVDAASGDFGLILQGPIDVRLGGFDRMDTKLARLLQQLRDGVEGITSIDLATDEIAVTSS